MSEQPFQLDQAGVRASFDRASARYESAATLQANVAQELLGRLDTFRLAPRVVLDLGAGTGRSTRALKRRYPRALVIAMDLAPGMLRESQRHQGLWRRFVRVCADAQRLPLAGASVDLVFSSLMLQWCDPPDAVLQEVRRVLKPGGFFAFSTFGPATLIELREAWGHADDYNHVNHFIDMHDLGSAAMRAGLSEPVLDVDRVEVGYASARALMRELKTIGAHNLTAGRPRSLLGRAHLKRMEDAYEARRRNGVLPATYEVIYGAGWGSEPGRGTGAAGAETGIPVGSIGRSVRR